MTSQPCLKRARSNDSAPEQLIYIQRSEFWQDDGNVILQARSTQFRVHKSMLSNHSSIFKDMFANAAPIGEELVEGCPVIHLSDSPVDMHHVLRAIYERGYFSVFEPQTLSTIAALLRLGDKYDMKVLHRDALRILHSGSPLELSTAPPLGTLFPQVIRRDGPAFGFDLVNVLYENAMEILLPVALYVLVCALNDIKDIFDGVDRADGTRAGLHPEVLRAAAVGYHKLTKRAEQLLFTWPLQCAKTCASQSCADQRLEFMEEVVEHSLSSHVIFVSMSWKIHPLVDSCQECTTFGRSEHKAGRKILWEEMPSTFGIQKSWADLQSDYAAMLK